MESLLSLALLSSLANQAVSQIEPSAGPTPALLAQSFHGQPCTFDCSGHQAGYDWAQRNAIADPDDCSGKSNSFIEGCRAAAEEEAADDNEDQNQTDKEDQL